MTDVFTRSKRSQIMSAIRSKGNRTTEWRLRSRLIRFGVQGWRVISRDILGSPDFYFKDARLAVFVDGCFWHGCRRCRTIPASNRRFWQEKIRSNRRRDSRITQSLHSQGYSVLRFWEHEVKQDPIKCASVIIRLLDVRSTKRGTNKRKHSRGLSRQ